MRLNWTCSWGQNLMVMTSRCLAANEKYMSQYKQIFCLGKSNVRSWDNCIQNVHLSSLTLCSNWIMQVLTLKCSSFISSPISLYSTMCKRVWSMITRSYWKTREEEEQEGEEAEEEGIYNHNFIRFFSRGYKKKKDKLFITKEKISRDVADVATLLFGTWRCFHIKQRKWKNWVFFSWFLCLNRFSFGESLVKQQVCAQLKQ